MSAAEMKHDPRCPAHGNPRWTDVGECGPCDSLAHADAPEGPPEDCECGDCYYVTPDCCGEPRPRCETGSAHDFYICSRGKGCDAERDRDAEEDAMLARMLLDDPVRHLMASGGVTACGVASDTLTPRTLTGFYGAVTCTGCRESV